MSNRRKLVPLWVPLLFGLMGFINIIGNRRLATLHGSDIVQLIAFVLRCRPRYAGRFLPRLSFKLIRDPFIAIR